MQHTTTFFVGYIVAFCKGWDMTLVREGVELWRDMAVESGGMPVMTII